MSAGGWSCQSEDCIPLTCRSLRSRNARWLDDSQMGKVLRLIDNVRGPVLRFPPTLCWRPALFFVVTASSALTLVVTFHVQA